LKKQFLIVQAHWYFDTHFGEYQHRIGFPGNYLTESGPYVVINCHLFHPDFAQLALNCDLLILHMAYQPEIQQLILKRNLLKKPTLIEIADDMIALGPWVTSDHPLRHPMARQNLLNFGRQCEGIQFSSKKLKRKFKDLNSESRLFKNHVSAPPMTSRPKFPFRFGWGGSAGHFDDIKSIAPAIHQFCAEHAHAVFCFMGHKGTFDQLFDALPDSQKVYVQGGSIQDYYSFLSNLHVGLAPLKETAFNEARSDVKYIEYAAYGVAAVLADAPVYREHIKAQRSMMFHEPTDLLLLLNDFIKNPERLGDLTKKAHHYASVYRSPKEYGRRIPFYNLLLEGTTPALDLRNTFGTFTNAQAQIETMRFGQALYFKSKKEEALKLFSDLHKEFPEYYLAEFWFKKTSLELGHANMAGLLPTSSPSNIYSDLMFHHLAEYATSDNQYQYFLDQIQNPWRTLSLLAKKQGWNQDLAHRTLAYNPFDLEALTVLARILAKEKPSQDKRIVRRMLRRYYPEQERWIRRLG